MLTPTECVCLGGRVNKHFQEPPLPSDGHTYHIDIRNIIDTIQPRKADQFRVSASGNRYSCRYHDDTHQASSLFHECRQTPCSATAVFFLLSRYFPLLLPFLPTQSNSFFHIHNTVRAPTTQKTKLVRYPFPSSSMLSRWLIKVPT